MTGAAGGLGRVLAKALAQSGAILALWDLRADALHECAEWLVRDCGVEKSAIFTSVVDVGDAEAVAAAAQAQLATLGPVRVVISNAAIVNGERVLDASEERLRTCFAVNALAHVWLIRAFASQLQPSACSTAPRADGVADEADANEAGVFVTVGSLMGEMPAARLADYCASKASTKLLHECLRWELHGRVHCLHVQPHLIDTPLFTGGVPGRFGWVRALLPALRAATVAKRIVGAIESRRTAIVVPYVLKWLPPLLKLLPTPLRDLALHLAGAACAMDGFVGGESRVQCLATEGAGPPPQRQQAGRRDGAAVAPAPGKASTARRRARSPGVRTSGPGRK